MFYSPGTHQMEGVLLCRMVIRTTECLSISCDDPLNRLADPLHPWHKTRQGVMRRNPIGQVEQIREPPLLRLATCFDVSPSFRFAQDPTDGQNDAICSAMPCGSFYTWVFNLAKHGFKVSSRFFFHLTVSGFFCPDSPTSLTLSRCFPCSAFQSKRIGSLLVGLIEMRLPRVCRRER